MAQPALRGLCAVVADIIKLPRWMAPSLTVSLPLAQEVCVCVHVHVSQTEEGDARLVSG